MIAGAAGERKEQGYERTSQREEEILTFDVSDEALEAAAGTVEKAGAFTLAFCSGLDTCPGVAA